MVVTTRHLREGSHLDWGPQSVHPHPAFFVYLPHSYQNELLWPLSGVWRNDNLFPKVTADCLCSPYSLSPFTFPQHGLPVGLCLCFTIVTRYLSYVWIWVFSWMCPSWLFLQLSKIRTDHVGNDPRARLWFPLSLTLLFWVPVRFESAKI